MSNILLWPYHVSLISKANVFLLINISAYHASWFTLVTFPIITKEIVFDLLPNPYDSDIQDLLEVPLGAITPKSRAKVHIKILLDVSWDFDFLDNHKSKLHRITFYPPRGENLVISFYRDISILNERLKPYVTVELDGHNPIRKVPKALSSFGRHTGI